MLFDSSQRRIGESHVARCDYCVAPTPKWKLNVTLTGIANQSWLTDVFGADV